MQAPTQKLQDIYKQSGAQQLEVRHLTDGIGTGEMECFQVAAGIQISYDSLASETCFQPIEFETDFLQINHCIEGCYEFEMKNGSVSFIGEGDLSVCGLKKGEQIFSSSKIPLKKYRGIIILLEIDVAQKVLEQDFRQANINLTQIRDTFIENPLSKVTITELSKMFHVAESSMKRCFTSIAGSSIGTFMKVKRMEAAAELLVSEPQFIICEVASTAGYENQSKFSAAFNSVFGMTPYAYRCKAW